MSSGTLATVTTAVETPEPANAPRIVPQRRYGRWAAFGRHHIDKYYARGTEHAR
ncbi:hypothetical protein ACFV2N_13265 [Streptomyces sp. NPDC059680]|uniref:hypothetical protein n=1 Tax=Streptomyces TaxID=1883 RepID=UPI001E5DF945|nr:hypothetical protein [Streptomyces barringtoniae]MCC5474976.1 hypothetical protein [Streptomyces barringtoniae]